MPEFELAYVRRSVGRTGIGEAASGSPPKIQAGQEEEQEERSSAEEVLLLRTENSFSSYAPRLLQPPPYADIPL